MSKTENTNASITKDNLLKLLQSISTETNLIAPIRNERLADINFLPVSDPSQICFDYDNTTTSPKEVFYPQLEKLFAFSQVSHDSIEVKDDNEEVVLFAVRSCDLKGIELLDKFFERSFEDDYYLSKRDRSVIISVACSELNDQCFCTSTGTGPILKDGYDIQLVDTGNIYAVQVGYRKGLELYEKYQNFFGPALDVNIERLLEEARILKPKFDLQKVYNNLKRGKVHEELWEDIANRCQSCGLCLFLCPTCSCYTVIDRVTPWGHKPAHPRVGHLLFQRFYKDGQRS